MRSHELRLFDTERQEMFAQQSLEKAENEPWLCNASDVKFLAYMVLTLCDSNQEWVQKYGALLDSSIKHGDDMLAGIVQTAIAFSQKD